MNCGLAFTLVSNPSSLSSRDQPGRNFGGWLLGSNSKRITQHQEAPCTCPALDAAAGTRPLLLLLIMVHLLSGGMMLCQGSFALGTLQPHQTAPQPLESCSLGSEREENDLLHHLAARVDWQPPPQCVSCQA